MGVEGTASQSSLLHSDKNNITGYGLEYLSCLSMQALEVINLSMDIDSRLKLHQ